jgi:RNA polymerase sigma-70 factor, ECF subfamily
MVADKIYLSDTEVPRVNVSEQDLSDHSLIEATRQGDEAAFAEIMRRYRSPLVNFLYRFLNDYEEAVDLAQETFVRIYFAIDRYHTSFAFSTYIYRIASNLAISELRRRKRRRVLSLTGLLQGKNGDDEATDFQPADERKLPDAGLVDDEQSRVIGRAIAALPEKYRLPLILRDIEGKSYEDVAAILELGLGTTKSRISRARGLLKEKLKGYVSNGDAK